MDGWQHIVVLGLALIALGCDAKWRMEASARTPSGAPVAGATVRLSCYPNLAYTTDGRGQLKADELGTVDGDCTVSVDKLGYHAVSMRAEDVCTDWNSIVIGGCRALKVEAVMRPVP